MIIYLFLRYYILVYYEITIYSVEYDLMLYYLHNVCFIGHIKPVILLIVSCSQVCKKKKYFRIEPFVCLSCVKCELCFFLYNKRLNKQK